MVAFQCFDVEQSGDVTQIRLKDPSRFDLPQYEQLRVEVKAFVQQRRPSKVLVDFSDVQFCSSAVVAAIMIAQNRLVSEGGQMKLCEMNEVVRQTFDRLKLDGDVFDTYVNKADAVNAF